MNKRLKPQIGQRNLLLIAAFIASVIFAANTFAVNVDLTADTTDPDCSWADGPGSELYVPAGKTCTLTGAINAQEIAGFTDYAIIVYSGGTLIIGDNTVHTTLSVSGDVLNMGTIYIGDGGSHSYSSTLRILNTKDLIIGYATDALLEVRNNPGSGNNVIIVEGTTYVGNSAVHSTPILTINSTSTTNDFGHIQVYGHMNINAGTITVASVEVVDEVGGTAELNTAYGSSLYIDSYYNDGVFNISLGIGNRMTSGTAFATIDGYVDIADQPAANVWVTVGTPTGKGMLIVGDDGNIRIWEDNSFTDPGKLTGHSNALWILSDKPYGLEVRGTISSDLFVLNNGHVNVTGTSSALSANNSYKQASSLNVGAGDELYVDGSADIDGDSQIDGTLTVAECVKVTNGASESFDIGSTAVVQIGNSGCGLIDTQLDDGLNVQGIDTKFTVANGADVQIYKSFTIDDFAEVDANGFFYVEEILRAWNGTTTTLTDTDSGDNFSAGDLQVEAVTDQSILSVDANSVLDLTAGAVTVGEIGSTNAAILEILGTLNIPSSSTYKVRIVENGRLTVRSTGLVQDDATSTQTFAVENGGRITNDGTINITNQQFVMDTGSITLIDDDGLLDSNSTVTPGFDYNGGVLQINNGTSGSANGAMKFDDTIDIDTAGDMVINGYLEGTDLIDFNGTGTKEKIGSSGEMKVVGAGTPEIAIYRNLDLFGKINANDGAGKLTLYGTNSPVLGGTGASGDVSYSYILTGELNIQTGASIDISNFYESYDPGGAETLAGSYGGEGAGEGTSTHGATKYLFKPDFDTSSPNRTGMYGYNSVGAIVAAGGGGIYIEVHGSLIVDGNIKANGEDAPMDNTGGGSGGLIVVDHAISHSDTSLEFKGAGSIQANGGNGTSVTNRYGGGGGRIIINSILFEDPDDTETGAPHYKFTGAIQARGGTTNGGTTNYGAAGTIVYVGDDNDPKGTLIVDQENRTLGPVKTYIPNSGDTVFYRIEARNGAAIKYAAAPASSPISCFENDGGSYVDIPTVTCTPNPDKPDTLHVNNSYTGAQTGDEPWYGATVTVPTLNPVFSVKARNPEDSTAVDKLRVQITQDPGKFDNPANYRTCPVPADCVWDADVTLDTATAINGRSIDFPYTGPTLTPGGTYYIRVAFYDSTGTNLGLWTHRDMDNHYKFTINSEYFDISNNCSDLIEIRDVLAGGRAVGSPLKYSPDDRYGYDSCRFTINSTHSGWKILYGMAPNETGLEGTATTFTPISNGTGDCIIDVSGDPGVSAEEEYGFNIADISGTSAYVQQDGECLTDYDSWNAGTGEYVYDIETNTNEDEIIDDPSNTITAGQFDLFTYGTVDMFTEADTYLLDTWMIITSSP